MARFKEGDVVTFKTQWPWAQRDVRIVRSTGPEGNYFGVPLPPFCDSWQAAPDGIALWLPEAKIVSVVPAPPVKLPKLPVIFRADRRTNEVVAVFPTIPADVHGTCFTCYAHVGQHSSASLSWYYGRTHRAATEPEYAALLSELRGIYGRALPAGSSEEVYELVPVSRVTPAHLKVFTEEVRRVRDRIRP